MMALWENGVAVGIQSDSGVPHFNALRLRKFTVEQFQKMLESGVLGSNARVELLEGLIIEKMTVHPPHAVAIELAQEIIPPLLPAKWRLRAQLPITTSDSQPEPDFAVVRGPARGRKSGHPNPEDIGLLIEVSDSSLEDDRMEMGRIYARAAIAQYWIVNLQDGIVEVYTRPKSGKIPGYSRRQVYQRVDKVPLILDGIVVADIAVADLLP